MSPFAWGARVIGQSTEMPCPYYHRVFLFDFSITKQTIVEKMIPDAKLRKDFRKPKVLCINCRDKSMKYVLISIYQMKRFSNTLLTTYQNAVNTFLELQ